MFAADTAGDEEFAHILIVVFNSTRLTRGWANNGELFGTRGRAILRFRTIFFRADLAAFFGRCRSLLWALFFRSLHLFRAIVTSLIELIHGISCGSSVLSVFLLAPKRCIISMHTDALLCTWRASRARNLNSPRRTCGN